MVLCCKDPLCSSNNILADLFFVQNTDDQCPCGLMINTQVTQSVVTDSQMSMLKPISHYHHPALSPSSTVGLISGWNQYANSTSVIELRRYGLCVAHVQEALKHPLSVM